MSVNSTESNTLQFHKHSSYSIVVALPLTRTVARFETTALALDSASGSVLSSEAMNAYGKHAQLSKHNCGAKRAESGAEAVGSKRAYESAHLKEHQIFFYF